MNTQEMSPDPTLDPELRSWVESAQEPHTPFPLQNLPWGIFGSPGEEDRIGVAIGSMVLDVQAAIEQMALQDLPPEVAYSLCSSTLNPFMGLHPRAWRTARRAISSLLSEGADPHPHLLREQAAVTMRLPAHIGDYTDFYASRYHAANVGRMFRPDAEPLLPNYLNLPVGYHGRSSSVVISGTPVHRPHGQLKPDEGPSAHGTCRLFDYEMEMGAFIGGRTRLGHPIGMSDATDHLFGVVILNDWSARDIQKWEYQPLGPFNGKNFASSISPWIVTLDALAPFRRPGPERLADDPPVLPYLQTVSPDVLDVTVEVYLQSATMRARGLAPHRVSRGNLADLTWTFSQMLAHHTSSGCPMNPGDLIGSGTISGPEKDSRGCLLEMTWRGSEPLELPDGTQRTFLQDGDEVIMSAFCERPGAARIGFGTCTGTVQPALEGILG